MKELIITCDCCKERIQESDVYELSHYIHVDPTYNRLHGHVKLIKGNSYHFSQRQVTKQFCLPCYNMLLHSLYLNFPVPNESSSI